MSVEAPGSASSAGRHYLANVEIAKRFLQEQHVETVMWHIVLNNTTSTRPKSHGGSLVRSLSEHKQFDSTAEGFATLMQRCVLRLPHSFVVGHGKELVAIGYGKTTNEADQDACCRATAQLLCAEPFKVVLRRPIGRCRRAICWRGCSGSPRSKDIASSTSLW